MSRNLRNKANDPPAVKAPSKTLQSDVSSDDDDYGGVDLVSDSDDDEPDVIEAEEQAFIEAEEDNAFSIDDNASQPQDVETDFADFEFEVDPLFEDGDLFNMAVGNNSNFDEAIDWQAAENVADSTRRVRFDLSDDDDSSSTGGDIFPDLFVDQDDLDPTFRRSIENDRDNDDNPSDGSQTCWDFQADENAVRAQGGDVADEDDDDDDDDSSSSPYASGYDSDGDTTEDDLPPAASVLQPRSILRRNSVESSASEEDVPIVRRNGARPGPRLAQWVTDGSVPFALIDDKGKRLMMFKARRVAPWILRARQQAALQAEAYSRIHGRTPTDTPRAELSSQGNDVDMSPMMSNSANLMMSAMHAPMDGMPGQAVGPSEAFYPYVSISRDGVVSRDSPSDLGDDETDCDDAFLDAFFDFDELDDGDEEENEEEDGSTSPNATEAPSTPARPSSREEEADPLLKHFRSGVVGAFRNNQTRHQLLSRNTASRASLAFSGPYNHGTLRGIKSDRLVAAANTPMTPSRRPKNPDPLPSSPAVEHKKRKSVAEESRGHVRKRSKSTF